MVQEKKDEVRVGIEESALTVFAQKGYLNTKMSDIAKMAGVSVGNIYTYFKNKEELFYSIVPEGIVEYLQDYLVNIVHSYNRNPEAKLEDYDFLSEGSMAMLIEYRRQLIIIFKNGEGTLYESAKEVLVNEILEAKRIYIKESHSRYHLNMDDGTTLMRIIIRSLLDMALDILEEEMNGDRRRNIFKALNIYRLYGIAGLNE